MGYGAKEYRRSAFDTWLDHASELRIRQRKLLPAMVVVALGEPGVPVVCWATTVAAIITTVTTHTICRLA
jgi:hypothetical protein